MDTTKIKPGKQCDFQEMLDDHIGGWGLYQWRYMIIFAVVTTELSYVAYSPVIYLYVPNTYWCAPPPQFNEIEPEVSRALTIPLSEKQDSFKQCEMYDVNYTKVLQDFQSGLLTSGNTSWSTSSCKHGWTYNFTDYYETLTTDLDWVCDNYWKNSFSQSLFNVGATVGTLAFGWYSDNFGRYKALMVSHIILLTTGIATPFCAGFHEIAFFAIRFLMGLSHNAYLMSFYALTIEYVSNSKRALVGNLSLAIWLTIGAIYQPWLARALGEWKTFHHILFAQTALIFFAPLFIDESCRWLISKGRIDETVVILKKIAKVNKKTVSDEVFEQFREYAKVVKEHEKKTLNWMDLFRTPRLRKNIILMVLTWMMISMAFDGHIRNTANIGYSFYITFTISVGLEFPSDMLAIWGLNAIGRRWSTFISMMLSSVSMIVCAFVLGNNTLTVIFAMIGRFCVTYAMNSGAQISMEIAPTELRGQGSGLANVFAQAAVFFSPYIAYSSTFWEPLPYLLLAFAGVIGAVASVFLPETAGTDLPSTVEEAEQFGKNQSFFYVPMLHDKEIGKEIKKDEIES